MISRPTLTAGALLLTGLVGGYFMSGLVGGDVGPDEPTEREVQYWVAPMDPNFRSDRPGTSPMGMDLVPVYADEAGASDEEPSLRISPTVINNLGVRTGLVERRTMHALVRTVGNVQPNEELTSHVHVRASGWIENLRVRSAGEEVSAGDVLFQYYAPELVNAQAEYLQALASERAALVAASSDRLQALGMSVEQIADVRQTRRVQQLVDIRAPQDGVLIDLNVGEGMYVQPGMTLMALADLSSVWVLVDVFEDDAPRMMTDLRATMRLPFIPGREWEGHVDYIYPTVDPVSRTLRVRLAFDDVDGALMPNMYGDIEVHGQAREGVLAIPTEALIRSSEGDRVVLALGDGRFRPAQVLSGIEVGGFVEVLGGLNEGETVVTSGQFLIDSEASLDASLLRLTSGEASMDGADTAIPETDIHEMDDDMAMEEPVESEPAIRARGTIVNVMTGHGMVRLTHEPIPALGWPEMTMNFDYVGSEPLIAFDAGTEVTFSLAYETPADGGAPVLVLVSIEPVSGQHNGDHQ